MSTKVTSKGQVTIPKSVREYLGLKAGRAVSFELNAAGEVVLCPAGRRPMSKFARLRGRATVKARTADILLLTRGD
jgi:antitoxin PrlF